MFNEELNAVKKELTNKSVPLPSAHPKFAGQAHWARQLKKRIERSMMVSYIFKEKTRYTLFCRTEVVGLNMTKKLTQQNCLDRRLPYL